MATGPGGQLQYYIAMPGGGMQNGLSSAPPNNQGGIQLQGLQNIQGLQTIQGLQGIQGLPNGAQIIVNQNGQPTIISMGNRDC